MDDRFFHGIIGSVGKVCGYHVEALTPWHHVILAAIDSPVMVPDKKTETSDILVFLKVIQTQWPDLPNLKPSWRDRRWFWKMKKPAVVTREMAMLRDWLDAQLQNPIFWSTEQNKGSGKSLSSPGIFALVVGLVSKGGIALDRAWNMRIAEARWYDATLAEINGADIKFAYENEADELREKLASVTDEDMIAAAKEHMPPAKFEKWLKNHKAKQR